MTRRVDLAAQHVAQYRIDDTAFERQQPRSDGEGRLRRPSGDGGCSDFDIALAAKDAGEIDGGSATWPEPWRH